MRLVKTRKFYVYDRVDVGCDSDIIVSGGGNDSFCIELARQKLEIYGCCCRQGLLSSYGLRSLRSVLNPFVRYLTNCYDFYEDEFCNVDFETYEIVRLPRIGIGTSFTRSLIV